MVTDRQTHTQNDYRNPAAHALRVNNDSPYVDTNVPSSVERGTSGDRIVDADDLVAVPPDDWNVVVDD